VVYSPVLDFIGEIVLCSLDAEYVAFGLPRRIQIRAEEGFRVNPG